MLSLDGVAQLALGGTHSAARLESGRLLTWGVNQNGLLGLGSDADMNVRAPEHVPGVSCGQVCLGGEAGGGGPNEEAGMRVMV